jgi:uncharacterized membrane protein
MRRTALLLVVLAVGATYAAGALVGVVDPSTMPVMVVAGAPLVLLFPGYALVTALFRTQPLPTAETWLYSVGLSITIVAFTGLALNVSPAGLTPRTWTVAVGLVTVVLAAISLARRLRRGAEETGTGARNSTGVDAGTARFRPRPFLSLGQSLLFALAGAIAVVAISVAVMGAVNQRPTSDLTSLWALPTGSGGGATMGVTNGSGQSAHLRVVLADARGTIREWPVELGPNETWQTEIEASIIAGAQGNVIATLSLAADPGSVIRRVVLRASSGPSPSR